MVLEGWVSPELDFCLKIGNEPYFFARCRDKSGQQRGVDDQESRQITVTAIGIHIFVNMTVSPKGQGFSREKPGFGECPYIMGKHDEHPLVMA